MRQELIEMLAQDLRSLWAYEDIMRATIDKPEEDREYQTAAGWADWYRARMQGMIAAAGAYDPTTKDLDAGMLRSITEWKYGEGASVTIEEAITAALNDKRCYLSDPRID